MVLNGVGVGRSVAVGPTLRMPEPLSEPVDEVATEPQQEAFARVQAALTAVSEDLSARGEKAGGQAQDVLNAQALMAADPTIVEDIEARLGDGKTGERAVFEAYAGFRDLLVQMGGYMAERATDLDDVSRRVIAQLRGVPAPGIPESDAPFILVAHDLAPADTALLDLGKVMGLITREGGPTSHTAILARSKSIPAIVGVEGAENLADGTLVVLDAAAGTVDTSPSEADVLDARQRIAERAALAAAPLTPGALADGTPVPLLANLGSADGAAEALAAGAEGVGLFRTEFLFLDASAAPTVEEQYVEYERMLRAFVGKKVVVRVLDAGADKPLSFLNDAPEENPALGLRGIRALRASEQILIDQLTALARAEEAVNGAGVLGAGRHGGGGAGERVDLWVMAPMVADADDSEYFTTVARELGIQVAGVMAEVPSSALVADQIFETADFVSIGTNDLTQYTLAADRLLGSVANLQDPWHPAVLRLVGMLGRAGRDAGKPVGVCGEAAADPLLAVVLVGLGVTSLSMTPAAIADVRAELARHTTVEAEALARAALKATSASRARTAVSRLAAANAVG
ncbi:phosphoenolpyruvate--protein phosphotransferase [Subtercola boreus]|uniref:Phosphoenolpyruvate-protein phosphotransferase n=1 Tax=Subtercola boreus TaxID=120213 RepID=A0A3E0VLV1_9MICO|nr:putative PEP-binding protein [Subtercola boreus]RFA10403.1 phosphoenolpyruvate--protein phosphotransferase [Subtercola boreus]TQL56078.1 phosphoenolpyruvate--protein phosphotransferase [Subtercola boreus]